MSEAILEVADDDETEDFDDGVENIHSTIDDLNANDERSREELKSRNLEDFITDVMKSGSLGSDKVTGADLNENLFVFCSTLAWQIVQSGNQMHKHDQWMKATQEFDDIINNLLKKDYYHKYIYLLSRGVNESEAESSGARWPTKFITYYEAIKNSEPSISFLSDFQTNKSATKKDKKGMKRPVDSLNPSSSSDSPLTVPVAVGTTEPSTLQQTVSAVLPTYSLQIFTIKLLYWGKKIEDAKTEAVQTINNIMNGQYNALYKKASGDVTGNVIDGVRQHLFLKACEKGAKLALNSAKNREKQKKPPGTKFDSKAAETLYYQNSYQTQLKKNSRFWFPSCWLLWLLCGSLCKLPTYRCTLILSGVVNEVTIDAQQSIAQSGSKYLRKKAKALERAGLQSDSTDGQTVKLPVDTLNEGNAKATIVTHIIQRAPQALDQIANSSLLLANYAHQRLTLEKVISGTSDEDARQRAQQRLNTLALKELDALDQQEKLILDNMKNESSSSSSSSGGSSSVRLLLPPASRESPVDLSARMDL